MSDARPSLSTLMASYNHDEAFMDLDNDYRKAGQWAAEWARVYTHSTKAGKHVFIQYWMFYP